MRPAARQADSGLSAAPGERGQAGPALRTHVGKRERRRLAFALPRVVCLKLMIPITGNANGDLTADRPLDPPTDLDLPLIGDNCGHHGRNLLERVPIVSN